MDHDDLLARVRETYQALDPVPAEVLASARAALAWRRPGAELAGLTGDHTGLAGAVRGTPARTLTFTARDTVIELEIAGTGREREIAGRLAPPSPARIRVRHPALPPEGPETRADDTGHFALPGIPEGLVSLLFHLPDGTSVVTSWIRL
ncbi:hypothetical protein [Spirillospora sp. NPDC029432]|uniref:hypothetical protein n=1 Tax=Spirillospora sp. NPDC029432 TaxID=3154599 RepID=UPI00345622D7